MNVVHDAHPDSVDDWFAVEERAFGANGVAPDAGLDEPDPDWQPV
jgi:hypothetical protein